MNAVAAIHGAADPQAARAAVARMLDRMPARAAGHRVIVAAERGIVGAAGAAPAFASKVDVGILAGDVRLDNAAALRHDLGLPADTADAVILIEAFATWGDAFASRLAGDFAFAILDKRGDRLIAVRDPLGVRPLYFREGTTSVHCASELRALVQPGDAPDEGFLAEVLAGDIVDQEGTPYLAIRRVPAGHMLITGPSGVKVSRYWDPPREIQQGSLAEHAERFRAAFDEAVRARCAGLARAGAHLSGGLDSSSVLASICANRFAEPVPGSLCFPWPETNERDWIEAVARKWHVQTLYVTPAVDPPENDLASAAIEKDIPTFPTDGPIFRGLHAAMKDAGASVILTGVGGDQWWTGELAHMADLMRRGRLRALRDWRRSSETMGQESAWEWRDAVQYGLYPLVPRVARRAWRSLKPAPLAPWIRSDFAARVDLHERLRRRPDTSDAPTESWRRMRWRLESGEHAFLLERYDRCALDSGVELRHPFYDRRLVELAFTTPQDAKLHGGRNRASMRAAMASRLPPEVATRTSKADFSRLTTAAAAAPAVEPYLAMAHLVERGWIDGGEARALARRVIDGGDSSQGRCLWRLLGVEAWLSDAFGAQ